MKIIRKMVFSTVFSKCTDGPKCATSQLKYWTISEKSFKINVWKMKRWKESWIFDSEKKNFYKKSKCLECFAANWQKIEVKQQKGLWKKCLGQVQKNMLVVFYHKKQKLSRSSILQTHLDEPGEGPIIQEYPVWGPNSP